MPAVFSIDSLITKCNQAFPAVGGWAYLTLLSGALATGVSYTADATTNLFTSATPHGLATGSRIHLVDGTVPSPLAANSDLFVIYVSTTTFKIAYSSAAALANIEADLFDAGSGSQTFTEQVLNGDDPLSVLVNKEISHPSWTSRQLIQDLGVAEKNINLGTADTPPKTISITNSSGTDLSFGHYLFIENVALGTAVLGSVPTAGYALDTSPFEVTILAGSPPQQLSLILRARNDFTF